MKASKNYSFSIYNIDSLDIDPDAALVFNFDVHKGSSSGLAWFPLPRIIYTPDSAEVDIFYLTSSPDIYIDNNKVVSLINVTSSKKYTITAFDMISGLSKSFEMTLYSCI
jgi:hypothetical protein